MFFEKSKAVRISFPGHFIGLFLKLDRFIKIARFRISRGQGVNHSRIMPFRQFASFHGVTDSLGPVSVLGRGADR
jgi:hypothetical protein